MKHFLLAFATVAALAAPVSAQHIMGGKLATTNKFTFKPVHSLTISNKANKLNMPLTSAIKPMAAMQEKATRNPKNLSYEVDGNELSAMTLVPLGLDYNALTQHDMSIGYAQAFDRAILDRYVGNKITKINFCPWMGTFTDGKVFIADLSTYNSETGQFSSYLWQKDVAIKGAASGTQLSKNAIDCDYTIPAEGLKQGIIVGFYAKTKASAKDPYAKNYGYLAIGYEDKTQAGAGGYIWVHDGSSNADYPLGSLSSNGVANALWLETEGNAGLRAEDACAAAVDGARGPVGSTQKVMAQFYNFGTDSIYNINYTFENDGKTINGTARFREPIKYYNAATFNLDIPVNATPGRHNTGKLTITKVNSKDDEYTNLQDNEVPNVLTVALSDAYKRTPVIEEFTSTTCGWCPFGIAGLPKAIKAVNNKAVAIAVHADFNTGYGNDPLVADSYSNIIQSYASSFPSAFINRETMTHAYSGIDQAVKEMAAKPCEASMTFTPKRALKGVKMETKLNFTIDAPEKSYGIAYVATEDNVESVAQLNYFALYYNEGTKKGNANYVAWYNNLANDCKALAKADFYTTDATDSNGNKISEYWSNFDMNHVACSIADPTSTVSSETEFNKLALPAIVAGQEVTHTYSLAVPTRKADNKKKYTSDVPTINTDNVKYAALLIDLSTGKIITGCQAKVGETATSDDKADLTAINTVKTDNAANVADITIADGAFNVKAEGAVAKVYDAQGRLVSSATVNGEASLPTFGKGVFVIRVVKGGNVTSQKAIF